MNRELCLLLLSLRFSQVHILNSQRNQLLLCESNTCTSIVSHKPMSDINSRHLMVFTSLSQCNWHVQSLHPRSLGSLDYTSDPMTLISLTVNERCDVLNIARREFMYVWMAQPCLLCGQWIHSGCWTRAYTVTLGEHLTHTVKKTVCDTPTEVIGDWQTDTRWGRAPFCSL